MKNGRALRTLVVVTAALFVVGLGAHLMIRKSCCEQLDDDQIRGLENAANAGNVAAMKRLYLLFEQSSEPEKAEAWLKRAADSGDADAEFDFWDRAAGPEKRNAMKYLLRSAEHGSSLAQATLGQRYRDGVDVARNIDAAKFWLRKSARAGEPAGVLTLCDLALAELDVQQCRECIELESRAIARIKPNTYYRLQLEQQRRRLEDVLRRPYQQLPR